MSIAYKKLFMPIKTKFVEIKFYKTSKNPNYKKICKVNTLKK